MIQMGHTQVFMQFFWQDFIYENISSFTDVSSSRHLYVWSKTQLPSCFAAGQQFWVNFLSSLQDCNMKSVQSNISLETVGKWTAHNRHSTGINIDIYWYNMRHMIKNVSLFQKPLFSQSTLQCENGVFKFNCKFSKSSVFLDKNGVCCVFESLRFRGLKMPE